jgi:nicotinate-nucleotide pyrophosphorylase (carboxylating)
MTLDDLIREALAEDLGPGDLTTEACVSRDAVGSARVFAKQDLVLAGQEVARRVVELCGGQYEILYHDGVSVQAGTVVALARGPLRSLLVAERTALNFLMRLSGIATRTRRFVLAAGGAFTIVDTRKTTPLHRALEKAAVRAGGARNHRFALFDGVLVKDNHILAAGGIARAVRQARASVHHLLRIEVEASTLEQAFDAVQAGAEAVLLDNMDDDTLAEAVSALRSLTPSVLVEASGNMDEARIRRLADKGILPDLISVGGLVHQATWVDLSMKLDPP